ncbi:MAG: LPS export ABC transporter periplasmic protein LptC [Gemmatimonadota bacterium]|nr:LPS export ABC transporter periplasmic protein LptC [Gemmatimonadota bacterium]
MRSLWKRSSLAALALGLVPAGCAREDEPPVAIEVLGEGVEMSILNMDTNLTREGVRRARLRADTADFIGEEQIRMRPVELIFYDEQGNELSVVTGDEGLFNETTEDMEAWGSVVAIDRRDDQRLETSRLRYVATEDRLFGDEPFTLYKDNGRTVLRGSAFETDPGLSSVLMFDSSGRTAQPPGGAPAPAPQPEEADVETPSPADTAGRIEPDTTRAAARGTGARP